MQRGFVEHYLRQKLLELGVLRLQVPQLFRLRNFHAAKLQLPALQRDGRAGLRRDHDLHPIHSNRPNAEQRLALLDGLNCQRGDSVD